MHVIIITESTLLLQTVDCSQHIQRDKLIIYYVYLHCSSSEVLNFIIFISSRVGVTKEISPIDWMQTLPLGHFLKKQSEPFGKLDINIVWKTDLHPGFTCVKHKVDKLEK